jgi:hypothetical protein
MTETKFRVLLVPPYLFAGCIVFIALLMGGSRALSNLLFAIVLQNPKLFSSYMGGICLGILFFDVSRS